MQDGRRACEVRRGRVGGTRWLCRRGHGGEPWRVWLLVIECGRMRIGEMKSSSTYISVSGPCRSSMRMCSVCIIYIYKHVWPS